MAQDDTQLLMVARDCTQPTELSSFTSLPADLLSSILRQAGPRSSFVCKLFAQAYTLGNQELKPRGLTESLDLARALSSPLFQKYTSLVVLDTEMNGHGFSFPGARRFPCLKDAVCHSFPCLKHLSIDGRYGIDTSSMSALPRSLTSLHIHGLQVPPPASSNLAVISSSFPHLKSLKLTSSTFPFDQISSLAALSPTLTHLSLDGSRNSISAEGYSPDGHHSTELSHLAAEWRTLAGLTSLLSLELPSRPEPNQHTPMPADPCLFEHALRFLSQLTYLKTPDCTQQAFTTTLGTLTSLVSLHIFQTNMFGSIHDSDQDSFIIHPPFERRAPELRPDILPLDLSLLHSLTQVTLSGVPNYQVAARWLPALCTLPALTALAITQHINPDYTAPISKMSSLQRLNIAVGGYADALLSNLCSLSELTHLSILGGPFVVDWSAHSRAPRSEKGRIGNSGWDSLVQLSPHLQSLALCNIYHHIEGNLRMLADLTKLTMLALEDSLVQYPDDVTFGCDIPSLRSLSLRNLEAGSGSLAPRVTAPEVTFLISLSGVVGLTELTLHRCFGLRFDNLAVLDPLQNLEVATLLLDGDISRDAAVFKGLVKLRVLDLRACDFLLDEDLLQVARNLQGNCKCVVTSEVMIYVLNEAGLYVAKRMERDWVMLQNEFHEVQFVKSSRAWV